MTPGGGSVHVSGVGATLNPVAARALNLYVQTDLFAVACPSAPAGVDAELG